LNRAALAAAKLAIVLPVLLAPLFASCNQSAIARAAPEERTRTLAPWLIPAIVSLPFDHDTLPAQWLSKYDSRRVAASLVERKHLFDERWATHSDDSQTDFPDPMSQVEMLSFFPEKYIAELLKHGQLNLHQVGHTQGGHEPWWRAELEDLMIGIHMEDSYSRSRSAKAHYLRPKYGILNFLRAPHMMIDPTSTIGSKETWLNYGSVIIVYRNEVKLRSTYMYGDSLEAIAKVPRQLGIPENCKPRPVIDLRPPDDAKSAVVYVEAQIWGPIDLSDIEEFRVPADRRDLVDKLKPAGLPIYAYNRAQFEAVGYPHQPFELGIDRAECLYAGDGKKQTKVQK